MSNAIEVTRYGFDVQNVQEIVNDGLDGSATPLPTFTPLSASGGFSTVGCATIIAPSQYGARITGAHCSIDSELDFPRGVRLAIIMGQVSAVTLTQIIQNMPSYVGAYGAGKSGSYGVTVGSLVPDLSRPGLQNSYFSAYPSFPASGVGLPISVLYDQAITGLSSLVSIGTAYAPAVAYGLHPTWAPGLLIPPNTTAAALFLSYRPNSGSNPVSKTTIGVIVRGSVHGYNLTHDMSQDLAGTPARSGNVLVPGILSTQR